MLRFENRSARVSLNLHQILTTSLSETSFPILKSKGANSLVAASQGQPVGWDHRAKNPLLSANPSAGQQLGSVISSAVSLGLDAAAVPRRFEGNSSMQTKGSEHDELIKSLRDCGGETIGNSVDDTDVLDIKCADGMHGYFSPMNFDACYFEVLDDVVRPDDAAGCSSFSFLPSGSGDMFQKNGENA